MAKVNIADIEVPRAYNAQWLRNLGLGDFYRMTFVHSGMDFNNRVESGVFCIAGDAVARECIGLPSASAGTVFSSYGVTGRNDQIYIRYHDGAMFVRGCGVNANSPWKQVNMT